MSIALRKLIRADDKYQSAKDDLGNLRAHFDTQALEEEIETLHKMLPSRTLTYKLINKGANHLVDALLTNQAHRSRIAEIYKEAGTMHSLITERVDTLKIYFRLAYSDRLKAMGTQKNKDDFILQCLASFTKLLRDIERLKISSKIILDDVDQSYWHLKAVSDIISTMAKRREI